MPHLPAAQSAHATPPGSAALARERLRAALARDREAPRSAPASPDELLSALLTAPQSGTRRRP